MSKTFVYIAGPYRATNGADPFISVSRNISEAQKWAIKLAQAGIPFFCPHMNGAHLESHAPVEYWLEMDMKILEHASVLLLIPGWRNSEGAVAEKERALQLGIHCYDAEEFDTLVELWLKSEATDDLCCDNNCTCQDGHKTTTADYR